MVKQFVINTFTRTLARLHEILLILPKLLEWVDEIDLNKPFYTLCPEVEGGKGQGLVEATHVMRSFDPCISCSIHTIDPDGKRSSCRIEAHD